MGHYASEMYPGWSESIDRTSRLLEMRDKLQDIPLSKFTAKDLPHLYTLFTIQSQGSHAEALRYFEERGVDG